MNPGNIFLFLSIFFGLLSLFTLFSREKEVSGKKPFFEKIIPYSKLLIRASAMLISISIALLAYYLITSDFSIHYVWQHTSKDLPVVYKISALWTGEAGSLMFLAWMILLLSVWISRKNPETRFGKRVQVLMLITGSLFLILTIIMSPFAEIEKGIPEDGAGLNPLLVNKWMIFHPPGIFIPYALLVIIFAAAMVYFMDDDFDEWERFSRPYGRAAWIILGAGMVAGIIWSYEVWENYWVWDPAFISILMTWLLLTAYLHSTGIYRKNRLRFLTPALAVNVFISAMYSTYIIRSGTIGSAHSFGEGSGLNILLLFVVLFAFLSECLLIYRYFSLKPGQFHKHQKFIPNKNILYGTIILLIGLAFILFWGLTASLILNKFGASVSINLYNTWSYPLTIALVVILAICMFKITDKNILKGLILAGIFILIVVLIRPAENTYTNLSLAVIAIAGLGTVYRIFDSIRVKGIKNKMLLIAPHIVHLGIVIILIGILLSTFAVSETLLFMKFNEKKSIGGYEIQLTGLASPVDNEGSSIITKIGRYDIYKDSVLAGSGEASFQEIKGDYITKPFIFRGPFSDVYIRYQGAGSEKPIFVSVANVRVIPGMSILWSGCILAVIGLVPVLAIRHKQPYNKI